MLIGILTGVVLCIATSIITPIVTALVKKLVLDKINWFKPKPKIKKKPQPWVIVNFNKMKKSMKLRNERLFEPTRKIINRQNQRYRIVHKLEKLNMAK